MPVKNIVEYLIKHSSITDLTAELKTAKIQGDCPVVFGGFADVYRATLPDGRIVAVKCIRQVMDEKYVKARMIPGLSKIFFRVEFNANL
ncbi:hypothetical protein FRC09_003432 [Ceratobasidium sp. 395]|nr:hypothetical protein FRC09_003432 [Ceratobasidium sp. 395]